MTTDFIPAQHPRNPLTGEFTVKAGTDAGPDALTATSPRLTGVSDEDYERLRAVITEYDGGSIVARDGFDGMYDLHFDDATEAIALALAEHLEDQRGGVHEGYFAYDASSDTEATCIVRCGTDTPGFNLSVAVAASDLMTDPGATGEAALVSIAAGLEQRYGSLRRHAVLRGLLSRGLTRQERDLARASFAYEENRLQRIKDEYAHEDLKEHARAISPDARSLVVDFGSTCTVVQVCDENRAPLETTVHEQTVAEMNEVLAHIKALPQDTDFNEDGEGRYVRVFV